MCWFLRAKYLSWYQHNGSALKDMTSAYWLKYAFCLRSQAINNPKGINNETKLILDQCAKALYCIFHFPMTEEIYNSKKKKKKCWMISIYKIGELQRRFKVKKTQRWSWMNTTFIINKLLIIFSYRVDGVAVRPWHWQKVSSQCQVTGDSHSISNFYYVRKTLLEEQPQVHF